MYKILFYYYDQHDSYYRPYIYWEITRGITALRRFHTYLIYSFQIH